MKSGGLISKELCIHLIKVATAIFKSEPNIVELSEPIVCVGDIHGQFYDLLRVLDLGGNPEEINYLFLGDYIDRGNFSVEVLLLLYTLKICYPTSILMLRGNHEALELAHFFNFEFEVENKYDSEVYEEFLRSFQTLPLACLMNKKFLALHGGISPDLNTLNDLQVLDRFQEPGKAGLFCDILWSDPTENDNGECDSTFIVNEVRGCSYIFGKEAINNFLSKNKLVSVIRGHEAQLNGFKMHKWNGEEACPPVITIFSAANYCDTYNNKGAIIKFEKGSLNIQQFNSSPHPFVLPNSVDIFSWSVPFIVEKIFEMFRQVFVKTLGMAEIDKVLQEINQSQNNNDENVEKSQEEIEKEAQTKMNSINSKVKAVAKLLILFTEMRGESEKCIKSKLLAPELTEAKVEKIFKGEKDFTLGSIEVFNRIRALDLANEYYPNMIGKKKNPKMMKKVRTTAY